MRVLICGDRNWTDVDAMHKMLDAMRDGLGAATLTIIEGGADGADITAGVWAKRWKIDHEMFCADWARFGRGAGPIRNQQMLDEGRPHLVIAFHDNIETSKGTADMVYRAQKAGVPVLVVSHKTFALRN